LKKLTLSFITSIFTSISLAGTTMNLEGMCKGTDAEGIEIDFHYFSNYDGCKTKSEAALVFNGGQEGLYTGERRFTEKHDIYTFSVQQKEKFQLRFDNITGRSDGTMRYLNEDTGKPEKIQLQCLIRDYHYMEC
jgi:hypothetical protein